jgi:hypothetical protein
MWQIATRSIGRSKAEQAWGVVRELLALEHDSPIEQEAP